MEPAGEAAFQELHAGVVVAEQELRAQGAGHIRRLAEWRRQVQLKTQAIRRDGELKGPPGGGEDGQARVETEDAGGAGEPGGAGADEFVHVLDAAGAPHGERDRVILRFGRHRDRCAKELAGKPFGDQVVRRAETRSAVQVREAQAHIREVERGAGEIEGQRHVGPFQAALAPRQRQRGGCLSGRLGRRGGPPRGLVGEAQPDAPQRHPQVAFHLDRAGATPTFTHIRNERGRGRGMHEIEGPLHVHFGAAAHLGMARAGRGMHGHALERGAGRGANEVGGQDGRALHAQMAVQALRHRPSGMIGEGAIDHIARQLQPAHRQSRQSARMAVVEDRRIVEPASHQAGV